MRKILVVIDMQNDFIDGSLGTKEAEAIVEKVAAKIRSYPAEDVFATRDTHPANYMRLRKAEICRWSIAWREQKDGRSAPFWPD